MDTRKIYVCSDDYCSFEPIHLELTEDQFDFLNWFCMQIGLSIHPMTQSPEILRYEKKEG